MSSEREHQHLRPDARQLARSVRATARHLRQASRASYVTWGKSGGRKEVHTMTEVRFFFVQPYGVHGNLLWVGSFLLFPHSLAEAVAGHTSLMNSLQSFWVNLSTRRARGH